MLNWYHVAISERRPEVVARLQAIIDEAFGRKSARPKP